MPEEDPAKPNDETTDETTDAQPGADAGSEPTAEASPDVEEALEGAQKSVEELSSQVAAAAGEDDEPASFSLSDFDETGYGKLPENIDLLSDVKLDVKIELGRTTMLVEDVLRLGEGCVVELDKLAGDPLDFYVNNRHIARGEVLVLNDNFCVRINEILSQAIPEAPTRTEAHPAA